MSEALKARLGKLLALARRGEGGEKGNASRLLNKLLSEHGLTLADLEGEHLERREREFSYRTAFEERLQRQIAGKVLNTQRPRTWQRRGSKSNIFEFNDVEYLEFTLHWEAYKAAWAKEQERYFVAFLHANRIFPDVAMESESPPLTPEQWVEIETMAALVRSIAPTPVHKALPTT